MEQQKNTAAEFTAAYFDEKTDRRSSGSEKYEPLPPDRHGREVIPMWVADMDFRMLPSARAAMEDVLKHGIFGYTLDGDDYKSTVSGWYSRRFGWNFQEEAVVNAPGVIYCISAGIRVLTAPGDGVLILEPVYFPFRSTILANKRVPVISSLRNNNGHWEIDFDDLDRKLGDAKAILFCSPHNPVGRVWSEEELGRVAKLAKKHNVGVICDEIHSDFVFEGHHIPLASLDGMAERTITCTAPTKTFNMAGIKGANIIIENDYLRDKFEAEKEMTGNADLNIFSIAATKAVYRDGDGWVDALVGYIRENYDILKEAFPEAGTDAPVTLTHPEGTYLAWLDCRGLAEHGVSDPQKFFLEEAGIRMNDGKMFGEGGDGFVRMNLGTQHDVVREAVKRMKDAISSVTK